MILKKLENLENYNQKIHEDGYVLIKKLINKNSILKIKKSLKKFLYDNKLKLKGVNFINKKVKTINTAHNIKKWKYLKMIQKNKKIQKIASKILKGRTKEFGAEVFAKPAKVGLQSPIHQDNFYWNIKSNKGITMWIALDEANKKNGSLYYFKKSHKLGLLPHEASNTPGSSQKIKNLKKLNKFKKVYPILKSGDVLIHDCLVAHGSNKNNSSKNRMGLTLRFIPAGSKFNLKNKKKYENSLKKQSKSFI